jgi:SAM-dependent methyltransferase
LATRVRAGDFTRAIPFEGPFDLVVDRAALVHNPASAMRRAMGLVHDRLRPGGKFIGIDWFSTEHRDAGAGERVDSHTRKNLPPGPFEGIGNVHFCGREDLSAMLIEAGFRIERLEHKLTEVAIPEQKERFGYWHFVAVKP